LRLGVILIMQDRIARQFRQGPMVRLGFLDHRRQRRLRHAPRLEEAREAGVPAEFLCAAGRRRFDSVVQDVRVAHGLDPRGAEPKVGPVATATMRPPVTLGRVTL
jgi:hypothetical protein